MVLNYPTDLLIIFACMDIYACFLFINASIHAPGADPCFLRAPPCFSFSHLCMRSAATFVCALCIPRSTSVTDKQRRTMWHHRQKHKRLQIVWDRHYNPLCITLFLVMPRCWFSYDTLLACSLSPFLVSRAWKSDTVWISYVSTFDRNTKIIADCGKPN